MSRGPALTIEEIEQARQLYATGLTWRVVGYRLNRDHSGLRKACGQSRDQSESQRIRWGGARMIAMNLYARYPRNPVGQVVPGTPE